MTTTAPPRPRAPAPPRTAGDALRAAADLVEARGHWDGRPLPVPEPPDGPVCPLQAIGLVAAPPALRDAAVEALERWREPRWLPLGTWNRFQDAASVAAALRAAAAGADA